MMKRTMTVTFAALMMLAALAFAQENPPGPVQPPPGVQGPGPGGPGGPGFNPMMMPGPGGAPMGPPPTCGLGVIGVPPIMFFLQFAPQIRLSDEQQGKLMELFGKKMQTGKPLTDKAMGAARDLRDAVMAKDLDPMKVEALAAESAKAEAVLVQDAIQTWKEIRGILTGEQMQTVLAILKQPPMPPPGMFPGMGQMGPGMPGGQAGPGPGVPPPPGR